MDTSKINLPTNCSRKKKKKTTFFFGRGLGKIIAHRFGQKRDHFVYRGPSFRGPLGPRYWWKWIRVAKPLSIYLDTNQGISRDVPNIPTLAPYGKSLIYKPYIFSGYENGWTKVSKNPIREHNKSPMGYTYVRGTSNTPNPQKITTRLGVAQKWYLSMNIATFSIIWLYPPKHGPMFSVN